MDPLAYRPEEEEDDLAPPEAPEAGSGSIPAMVQDLVLGAHGGAAAPLQLQHRMPWTLPGQAAAGHGGHGGVGRGPAAAPGGSRSDAVLRMVAQKYGAPVPSDLGPDAIREAQVKDYLARKWGEAGRQANIAEGMITGRSVPSAATEPDRNLQDLMVRRGAAAQEAQAQMAHEDMAAEKDPASTRSQLFRAIAKQVGGADIPEDASASDVRGLLPQLSQHFNAAAQLATRKDTIDRARAESDRRQTETERHNRVMESRPVPGMAGPEDAKAIADAIEQGLQPPDMKGLYRFGAPVKSELAKRGYDLTTASREWQGVSRMMSTLNNPQQIRMRQGIDFAYHSLDQIEDLYNQWQKVGPASGFRVLNRGALAAARNLPGQPGAVAQGLQAQINDLTEALANVYMGGGVPTDNAFKLAQQNLQGDWNEETFKKSLALVRNNLKMRQNAMMTSAPAGIRPDSPYWKQTGPGEAPATGQPGAPAPAFSPAQLDKLKAQLTPGETLVVDDQGKPQALKPGAALPKGWTRP